MVRDTLSGGGLPTCQIFKACLERQKSYRQDMICYGRTDGQTDHYRAFTPFCGGALIKGSMSAKSSNSNIIVILFILFVFLVYLYELYTYGYIYMIYTNTTCMYL